MNKIFAFVLFIVLSASSKVKSQEVKIAIAPEINFPAGNASNISGIGFGGALKAELGIAEKYAITANGGYNLFIGKKYFGSRIENIDAIPAKLGFKYYSSPDFYLEAQAGAAFHLGSTSRTSFIWSSGIGTYFKTGNADNKLDFGLRYEAWSNASYNSTTKLKSTGFGFIGLKLGYSFGL